MIWIEPKEEFILKRSGKNYLTAEGMLDSFWRWVKDSKYFADISTKVSEFSKDKNLIIVAEIKIWVPKEKPAEYDTMQELYSASGHSFIELGSEEFAFEKCETGAIRRAIRNLGFGLYPGATAEDAERKGYSDDREAVSLGSVPSKYWDNRDKSLLPAGAEGVKKIDGVWQAVKYVDKEPESIGEPVNPEEMPDDVARMFT